MLYKVEKIRIKNCYLPRRDIYSRCTFSYEEYVKSGYRIPCNTL